ncbi:MAG TPA: hypothetical protein VMY87_06265 [Armatimonadota bacterium]|nr:hypothetical protein [Armatimonadota bacterium]
MKITTRVIARARLGAPVWDRVLVVVSDLHQNSRGGHDNFQARLFKEFLLQLIEENGRDMTLFIAGDRHERLEEPRGARLARNNLVVDRIMGRVDTIDLPGNHDDVDGDRKYLYEFSTDKIHAWHGHQLDPACSGAGRLDKVGSAVWGALERVGLGKLLGGLKERALRAVMRRRKTASLRQDDNTLYIEDARARMEAARAEDRLPQLLYVCGHTHGPQLVELGDGAVFANAGCWTRRGLGYAVVVDAMEVELIEVREAFWRALA